MHCLPACRSEADWLQQVASNAAAECDGQPCLLLVADRLAEAVCELAEAEAETAAAQRQRAGEQPPAASGATAGAAGVAAAGKRAQREARGLVLSRRCVWFHHIKALGKRKHIVEWGGDLGLGGFSKPGFPGILLVEVCCLPALPCPALPCPALPCFALPTALARAVPRPALPCLRAWLGDCPVFGGSNARDADWGVMVQGLSLKFLH